MFCVIRLKQSKRILVINQNWIRGFNEIKFHNHGVKLNAKQIVFYSAIQDEQVNFGLPQSQLFQPNIPSTYEAILCKFFGKYWTPFYLFIFATTKS